VQTILGESEERKQNTKLPDGSVAYGNYNGDKVKFNWNNPGNENDNSGFREEISRTQGASSSFLRI